MQISTEIMLKKDAPDLGGNLKGLETATAAYFAAGDAVAKSQAMDAFRQWNGRLAIITAVNDPKNRAPQAFWMGFIDPDRKQVLFRRCAAIGDTVLQREEPVLTASDDRSNFSQVDEIIDDMLQDHRTHYTNPEHNLFTGCATGCLAIPLVAAAVAGGSYMGYKLNPVDSGCVGAGASLAGALALGLVAKKGVTAISNALKRPVTRIPSETEPSKGGGRS